MLAVRLTRRSRPAVQLRRLLVAAASAGTGFLLLSTLGYAMSHPDDPAGSMLRLAWCLAPLAATVHFAVAVARTDPGTRPRPGLAAIGLGPARLMVISATTTALSCALGSLLALLVFLHLRGDLTGMPFDGAAAEFLAAHRPFPLPAALTLLTLLPTTASTTVALSLRPRDPRPKAPAPPPAFGRFGARRRAATRETFGAYGRFGARLPRRNPVKPQAPAEPHDTRPPRLPAGSRPAGARGVPTLERSRESREWDRAGADGTPSTPGSATHPPATADGTPWAPGSATHPTATVTPRTPALHPDPHRPFPPRPAPSGLPWGIATLAAGLAVEAYGHHTRATTHLALPGGLPPGPLSLLIGWTLTALGLALAGPGLTHLCGRLLQTARPGALRLLAGRVLMEEAARIGRPLGVVCAVASAMYTMAALSGPDDPAFGPLTTLGTLLVTGCTLATLLTAAVEARQARADTTAALLRLGAPATVLRSATALRAGALLALFAPLTLLVAELSALPLTG